MSLFPLLSGNNRNCWGPSDLVRRIFDDDFGGSFLDGELFDPPYYHQRFYIQPRHQQQSNNASLVQQGNSVACTPDKFAIRVDTRNFTPEEITVKTQDNCVVIHGKHEEKSDDRGCYVKREFTRRYVLPEDVDPQTVKCHLQPSGLLALEAPRKNAPKEQPKAIPIKVQHEKASGDAKK
ncbi:alpha-crystallin A chain-like [Dermacentor variabilis]|uniref:alpha-crystallin A chain-like n=1 Tax=Dermacentor variabilis TaxID=34621 RepID=UPI003F5B1B3C